MVLGDDSDSYDDEDSSSSDTEDYLDLADLNDFQECNSPAVDVWLNDKQKVIEKLIENRSDAVSLRDVCISRGGLLNDELRRRAWPLLLDADMVWDTSPVDEELDEEIRHHHYYNQVVLDVKRILKRFPPGIDEVIQADLQVKVTQLIIRVLIANEGLHYYQGFHDVAITLLLVLGEKTSFSILSHLARSHFQLFMGPDMSPTMEALNLVYALVKSKNPNLYDYLMRAELGTIFCLPWTITWFGHVLNTYETVVRLFDVFISSHPWTSMYLSAVIVLHRAGDIFLTPCEMPLLHQMLSNVPENLPFDVLIDETEKLMEDYPPEKMERAVRDMHRENMLRIKREEEETKRRMELRRRALADKRNAAAVVQRAPSWRLKGPLTSRTVKVVALSLSVATVAWICNYIRPTLEVF